MDFVGGERLDLHHTFRTGTLHNLCDDAIGLCRITCPVDLSSSPLDGGLELQQVLIEMVHNMCFNCRASGTQSLPVRQFANNGVAFGADASGRFAQIATQLAVAQGRFGGLGKRG